MRIIGIRTLAALSIVLFSSLAAPASTLTFNGNTYTDAFPPTDYFTSNPTRVGGTTVYRFFWDVCAGLATYGREIGLGRLSICGIEDTQNTQGSFFTGTYDGASGDGVRSTIFFFTVSFSPTFFTTDPDYLTGNFHYALDYHFENDANADEYDMSLEGAIAPVPVPAGFGLLGMALLGLGVLRRRSA